MVKNSEYEDAMKRVFYADIAERYEDMIVDVLYTVKIAKEQNIMLDLSARNYFNLAFKNVLSKRRSSWRLLNNEKNKKSEDSAIIDEKLHVIVEEILKYTAMVFDTIEKYMPDFESIKDPKEKENCLVFVYKMKGDYLRYKAEVQKNEDQVETSKLAQEAYQKAIEYSSKMSSTDPLKLGLYLNYSVFHYEILKDADQACKLAKDAFEVAVSELDQLNETYYKDSTLIMQLLRDNLTLWTTRNDVKKPE